MLAKALRNNIKPIKHPMMRTKATKFGNMFAPKSKAAEELDDVKSALDKLFYGAPAQKPEVAYKTIEVKDEVSDYIVEDPNAIIVSVPERKSSSSGNPIPFFKSLSIKLANL